MSRLRAVAPVVRNAAARRQRIAVAALAGLILSALFATGSPASGAEAQITPSPTGYFTRTQDPLRTVSGPVGENLCSLPSPDPRTCVNPAQITGGTPQYPRKDNYIYVARILGNDDARGTIAVPLFSLPFGAEISQLTLSFYVENEPNNGSFNFDPENPGLFFCLLTQGWAGQDAGSWSGQPFTDCSVQALPKKIKEEEREETTEEGAPESVSLVQYSVDLLPMAQAWAAGRANHGVMVLPTPDAPDTFEVAIRTPAIASDGMTIKAVYTAEPPPPIAAPVDDFGSTGAAQTSFDDVEPPAAPEPDPAPAFTVAEPEPQPASVPVAGQARNPWWIFLALPIGFATLAAMGRGVAEPVGVENAARRGPVSRLMDRGGL